MRTASVREFRDGATRLLRGAEPILVTRRGKIVGFFLPAAGADIPLEIRRDLFYVLTRGIRGLMKARRLGEDAILADFETARKARRRR
jgi:hypothetical protein